MRDPEVAKTLEIRSCIVRIEWEKLIRQFRLISEKPGIKPSIVRFESKQNKKIPPTIQISGR
jgi:hypothetical protein